MAVHTIYRKRVKLYKTDTNIPGLLFFVYYLIIPIDYLYFDCFKWILQSVDTLLFILQVLSAVSLTSLFLDTFSKQFTSTLCTSLCQ